MEPMGRIVLDMRGLLIRSMKGGEDPDALLTADGQKVATAAHGLCTFVERYLQPLLQSGSPVHLVAVWDAGNDYRKSIWPDYKKRRTESAEEMDELEAKQYDSLMKLGKSLMAGLGVIQVECPGQEADDVIAFLTQETGGFHIVYTVDSDLLAVARENVVISLPDGVVESGCYHPSGVEAPIPPHLVTLYKSICGDTSDQYPGIPGMGAGKWNHLHASYGQDGLEELDECVRTRSYQMLWESAEFTDDKWLRKLYDERNHWELMYDVARLHPELCTGVHGQKITRLKWLKRRPSRKRVEKVLDFCDAADLMAVFEPWMPSTTLCTADNLDEVLEFLDHHLPYTPVVAFDFETKDTLKREEFKEAANGRDVVDTLSSTPIGASFTVGAAMQHTVYVSTGHAGTNNVSNEILVEILNEISRVLGKPKAAHNVMFEDAVCKNALGIDVGEIIDTRQMAALVDENLQKGLKPLSKMFLGEDPMSFKELLEQAGVEYIEETTAEQALEYGCDDSSNSAHLWHLFDLIITLERTNERFYSRLVKAYRPVVDGFIGGAGLDERELEVQAAADAELIEAGDARIRELLEEHCSAPNPMNAEQLVADESAYLKMKLEADGKDAGEIEEKLKQAASDRYAATAYEPLQEQIRSKEFKPTPLQINEVAKAVGIAADLSTVAVSRINEFLAEAREEDGLSGEATKFLDLLADASDQIRKKEGEEYEEFLSFCQEKMDEKAPRTVTGTELNFGSPKQMQNLFYGMLGLPIRIRTIPQRGSFRQRMALPGSPSVSDMAVNAAMAEDCQDPEDWRRETLLTYLEVKHAKTRTSLYWKPYPLWRHPKDGRIHPGISLMSTVTHRPTGSSPNLLQVAKGPVRKVLRGREEDHVILSPDFNGQELRILASETLDPLLLDVYLGSEKKDPHTMTSCIFGPVALQRINPEALKKMRVNANRRFDYADFMSYRKSEDPEVQAAADKVRKMAKVVNFLTSYMGTPPTLALKLWIQVEFAEEIQNQLFAGYARIEPWQQEVIEVARRQGYVENAYGIRRHLNNGIFSKDNSVRRRLERQAVNFMIQGCASQILADVLAETDDRDYFRRYGANLIAPVYDEFAVSVPISRAPEAAMELCEIMRVTPPGHRVPMIPELSLGRSWGSMIELGEEFTLDGIAEGIEKSIKKDEEAQQQDEYESRQSPDLEEREAGMEEVMEVA